MANCGKVLAVVKMRGSEHSKALRAYDVTDHGIVLGEALSAYSGIITGVAHRRADAPDASADGAP